MFKKNQGNIFIVMLSLLFIAFCIFVVFSKLIPQIGFPIVALSLIVFITAFIKTDIAIIILIFSMLLSPELKLAEVPDRAVVVRIDDILLFLVFFGWLFKMAINKQLALLKHTSINRPIAVYILVYVLATGLGILDGKVHATQSFFYLLKYIEYFMLYFMVTNILRSKKQVKRFIIAVLITCTLTCIYANVTLSQFGRATAPFEGLGEANTLGGYLVLLFAIVAGLFLYSKSTKQQFWLIALAGFIFLTLLNTLSRGSYLAFIPMYLILIILTKRKRNLLIIILMLAIFTFPLILPNKVIERITATFIPGKIYRPLGEPISLDSSASARIEGWKRVVKAWKIRPILGYGATGVGFIDTQYARVLGETGLIGFWIFVWLMATIFRHSLITLKIIEDDWGKGLTLGFLAGFVGLLVHSFSACTFIIIRIMEPFWFLAAVVMMLPRISSREAQG